MESNRSIPCSICKGKGADYVSLYDECGYTYWKVCVHCQGRGYLGSNDSLNPVDTIALYVPYD